MTEVQISVQRPTPVGELMRRWREQRGYSQLTLATRAEISTRHLSFLETGRSRPSREMVLRLGRHLDLALRDRNQLLLAAGYAPAFTDFSLESDAMAPVRDALRQILAGHEPFPALVVDRNWNIVASNSGLALFTEGVAAELLHPPVNALRLAVHPDGMRARITNFAEWREQLLRRLQRRVEMTAEPGLTELYLEILNYPVDGESVHRANTTDLTVPLRLRYQDLELSLICTVATFGMPLDVTVADLAIEAFLPADTTTGAALTLLRENGRAATA